MKKWLLVLLSVSVLASSVFVGACAPEEPSGSPDIPYEDRLEQTESGKSSLSIEGVPEGDRVDFATQKTLNLTVKGGSEGASYIWSTSNEQVATVKNDGACTILKVGTVTVFVREAGNYESVASKVLQVYDSTAGESAPEVESPPYMSVSENFDFASVVGTSVVGQKLSFERQAPTVVLNVTEENLPTNGVNQALDVSITQNTANVGTRLPLEAYKTYRFTFDLKVLAGNGQFALRNADVGWSAVEGSAYAENPVNESKGYEYVFSPTATKTYFFAIRSATGSAAEFHFTLDNFKIEEIEPVLPPEYESFDSATKTGTSVVGELYTFLAANDSVTLDVTDTNLPTGGENKALDVTVGTTLHVFGLEIGNLEAGKTYTFEFDMKLLSGNVEWAIRKSNWGVWKNASEVTQSSWTALTATNGSNYTVENEHYTLTLTVTESLNDARFAIRRNGSTEVRLTLDNFKITEVQS